VGDDSEERGIVVVVVVAGVDVVAVVGDGGRSASRSFIPDILI